MGAGRDAELEQLGGAIRDAADGRARALLIVGEVGMGKSAMLTEVAEMARTAGFEVARTASPEGADQFRYAVLEDIVRGLPGALENVGPEDAALLGSLSRVGEVGPDKVASALLALLSAHEDRAIALLLDDLHWADSPSVAALTLAVGRVRQQRLLVVATARPRPATDPRLYSWTRLDLAPLDWRSAITMLRDSLPDGLSEALTLQQADRVVEALGRHPLAITECLRILTPAQVLGAERLPEPIPLTDRLLDAWGRDFRAMPEATRRAVLALCVTRGSGTAVLDGVLAEFAVSRSDLAPAVSAGLVPPGRAADQVPQPPNALVVTAVLASADPALVRRMHLRAADVSRELGLAPLVVAAHLEAGGEPDCSRCLDQLIEEADRAMANGQGNAAARALFWAARRSCIAAQRSDLAVQAARTLLIGSRDRSGSDALLPFLDTLELTAEQRVWALWLRGEHLSNWHLGEALAALVAAADLATQCDSPALPQILWSATFLAWAFGDGPSALDLARRYAAWEQASDYAHPDNLPPWAGTALLGVTLYQVGQMSRARELIDRARRQSAQWRGARTAPIATLVATVVLDEALTAGRPADDSRLRTTLSRLAGDPGDFLAFMRNIQAVRTLRTGDLRTTRLLVDDALSLSRAVQSPHNVVLRLCLAVRLDAIVGDAEALEREAGELRQLSRQLGHVWGLTFVDRTTGLLHLGEGRYFEALRYLQPLASDRLLLGFSPEHPVLMGRADLVEALARAGELDAATEVLAGLERLLAEADDPFSIGLLARCRGLVASGAGATAELELAVRSFRDAGDSFELARAKLALGESLRRERRTTQARRSLRAAAALFERMESRPWLARTHDELAATGAPSGGGSSASWAPLTAQEQRVATAVCQGLSNKDIAAALSLSPRTVEHHLSSAFRKLGVSSRTALVTRLTVDQTL